jgi:hypothetical protein
MSEFRRKLLMQKDDISPSIFDSAVVYLPFKTSRSVIDVNNGISPSINTGRITSAGYYTNGYDQQVDYTDSRVIDAIQSKFTIFLEFTPYSMDRNCYYLDVCFNTSLGAHIVGCFIYHSRNKELSATITKPSGSQYYLDGPIANFPSVVYGQTYKICVKYDLSSYVDFFTGNIKTHYNYPARTYAKYGFTLGKNTFSTNRGTNADFINCALWDRLLTDEECFDLVK